jgi:hypothetical protein
LIIKAHIVIIEVWKANAHYLCNCIIVIDGSISFVHSVSLR